MSRKSEDTLEKNRLLTIAIKRLELLERREWFDPNTPGSKPTKVQAEVIEDFFTTKINNFWCLGGNQGGKSVLALYIAAKLMQNERRPIHWNKEEALLGLVLSRNSKQLEESLWPKLQAHLEPGTYKCIRTGNALQSVHFDNGNRLIFQSYENEAIAQQRIQSFTLHLVIQDEMPSRRGTVEEAQRRLQAKDGKYLGVFTPKLISKEVRNIVETAELPYSKRYILRMFDNPIYTQEAKDKIMAELSSFPDSYKKTVLEGAWAVEGNLVYHINQETMIRYPEGYSPHWRHLEGNDPAISSALGLTLLAEHPNTGDWYVISSEKVAGIFTPSQLVKKVQEKTGNVNIFRRVMDSSATWYSAAAREFGLVYTIPFDKNNRRLDMIKQLQERLGKRVFISPTCEELLEEFYTYHWADSGEGKVVNGDKYHLLDSLRYAVDCLPPFEQGFVPKSWDQKLRDANDERIKTKQLKKEGKVSMVRARVGTSNRWKRIL